MKSGYPFHYDKPSVAAKGASEVAIQASCKLRVEYEFGAIFIAIPNGGKRGWQGQYQIKREGVRKGAPDSIILGTGKNAGRVVMAEFKAGSSLSLEQFNLLTDMHEARHHVGVFRSQDTIFAKMLDWGWLPRSG